MDHLFSLDMSIDPCRLIMNQNAEIASSLCYIKTDIYFSVRFVLYCNAKINSANNFPSTFSISEGRAIFVTFFPSTRSIFVVVVNPYQNKDLSSTFLERQFREASQMLSGESQPPKSGITYKVNSRVLPNLYILCDLI